MNVEEETDSSGGLSKESVTIALTKLFEKIFSATVVAPALSQIGLTLGDRMRFFRIKNLMSLNQKLDEVLEERNLQKGDLKTISLAIGFPLLEKASYQDDDVLQNNWAHLLASAMDQGRSEGEGFGLETYVH